MTVSIGSVTVASDESRTGSGMALAIYDADVATLAPSLAPLPTLGATTPPYTVERPVEASDVSAVQAGRLAVLRDAARRATVYASGIVTTLHADGIGV